MLDKAAITRDAQKYASKGQIDKAIVEWQKLLRETPDGNIFNIVGDLYLRKNAKKEAVETFTKAATIFREDGFYLKAMALYKKILNINPAEITSLIALAELNAEKGLIGNANETYLTAAEIYTKAGAVENALEIYSKMLELSPTNIPLKIRMAELYFKIGLKTEAIREYLKIAEDYTEKEDLVKAQEFLQRVIGLDPQNTKAIIGLSRIAEKSRNQRQAFEYLKHAKTLSPNDPEILLAYSQAALNIGNIEDAKVALTRLIEIDPTNTGVKKLLGTIYLKEGKLDNAWPELLPCIDELLLAEQWDEALGLLNNFKALEPIEVLRRLTTIYKGKGKLDAAITELKALAELYENQNRSTDALQSYKEVLELHPDDITVQKKIKRLEHDLGEEVVPPEITPFEEKSIEEALAEIDVHIRYGLLKEAASSLELLKEKATENLEILTKLKNLYIELEDKDKAIGECINIAGFYERAGDIEKRNALVEEALRLNPDDPRLISIRPPIHKEAKEKVPEEVSTLSSPVSALEEEIEEKVPEEVSTLSSPFGTFEENLAEADFYAQQGLDQEAIEIYERLLSLTPENREIIERLDALRTKKTEAEERELPVRSEETRETVEKVIEEPLRQKEELTIEELIEVPEEPKAEISPTIDKELIDIFQEFKKGLEKELETEDYETHYNLGIAYKEMGLLDDAIREFQTSAKDAGRIVQSSSMLGLCYMEKNLYPLAIKEFSKILQTISPTDEGYLSVKYDLAEAYEKNQEYNKALALYMDVYGQDAKFRDVVEKVNSLKKLIPEKEEKPKSRKDRVSYL